MLDRTLEFFDREWFYTWLKEIGAYFVALIILLISELVIALATGFLAGDSSQETLALAKSAAQSTSLTVSMSLCLILMWKSGELLSPARLLLVVISGILGALGGVFAGALMPAYFWVTRRSVPLRSPIQTPFATHHGIHHYSSPLPGHSASS